MIVYADAIALTEWNLGLSVESFMNHYLKFHAINSPPFTLFHLIFHNISIHS